MAKDKKTGLSTGHHSRATFSGSIGYVLAMAGSAVGLGNIWRFPYLAAKYGGGIFLIIYIILVLTFGYALIASETTLGRMTGKSPAGAFASFGNSKWLKFGGWVNSIVPMLIVPYYCVIGGWVIKYLVEYVSGNVAGVATDTFFTGFIGSTASPLIFFAIFVLVTFFVIIAGVKNGIEKASKIMMPILIVLAIFIAIYSMTRPGAIEGIKYFFIPNFENFSIMTVVAAMGQMFFSLSLAMGIIYTYGSYLKKDVDIDKSTKRVEFFDTGIAVLAGLMIIPAVFAFSGGHPETLNAGPSLMFITMPKVFESMGFGLVIGIIFFVMVLFAALTSAISLMEACAATISDQFKMNRKKAAVVVLIITLVLGSFSALGFSAWDFVTIIGMSVLDFFDFITNSVMMPLAALATCILVVRVVGFKKIEEEIMISSPFKRKKLYYVVTKYVAPICLVIVLISSILNVFGIIKI